VRAYDKSSRANPRLDPKWIEIPVQTTFAVHGAAHAVCGRPPRDISSYAALAALGGHTPEHARAEREVEFGDEHIHFAVTMTEDVDCQVGATLAATTEAKAALLTNPLILWPFSARN
jgi:hypothetical protein